MCDVIKETQKHPQCIFYGISFKIIFPFYLRQFGLSIVNLEFIVFKFLRQFLSLINIIWKQTHNSSVITVTVTVIRKLCCERIMFECLIYRVF